MGGVGGVTGRLVTGGSAAGGGVCATIGSGGDGAGVAGAAGGGLWVGGVRAGCTGAGWLGAGRGAGTGGAEGTEGEEGAGATGSVGPAGRKGVSGSAVCGGKAGMFGESGVTLATGAVGLLPPLRAKKPPIPATANITTATPASNSARLCLLPEAAATGGVGQLGGAGTGVPRGDTMVASDDDTAGRLMPLPDIASRIACAKAAALS